MVYSLIDKGQTSDKYLPSGMHFIQQPRTSYADWFWRWKSKIMYKEHDIKTQYVDSVESSDIWGMKRKNWLGPVVYLWFGKLSAVQN